MIQSTDLKAGVAFLSDGKPYKVIKYSLIKMGRGGATVKVSVRNLETGAVTEKSLSSNVSVDEVNTYKRGLQYLYKDGKDAFFMDPKNYDQVEVPLATLGEDVLYIKEGDSVNVSFWDEKALAVELPPKVVMKVATTDPGVKGNSASNIYKSAVLENGVNVKVPLFINTGDLIRVDTRTGEYVERAK